MHPDTETMLLELLARTLLAVSGPTFEQEREGIDPEGQHPPIAASLAQLAQNALTIAEELAAVTRELARVVAELSASRADRRFRA
jgi:hypothetical protein